MSAKAAQASRNALASLAREPGALIGGSIVCFFVVLALFAPLVAPYDPIASDWGAVRLPPDLAHPSARMISAATSFHG
ncbi:MAG: hypothetical protein WA813_12300 [Beijerinckiaceae bacterium]